MERLYKRLLEDVSVVHRAVGLRAGIGNPFCRAIENAPGSSPRPVAGYAFLLKRFRNLGQGN